MTHLEIDAAIINITKNKCDERDSRLVSIPKENVTERKAVLVEYGMYTFCGNAGFLFQSENNRLNALQIRQKYLERELYKYPKLNNIYLQLDEDEKMKFTAALQAEIFIRDQCLPSHYAELMQAEEAGAIDKIFELKIKIGAILSMFNAWECWRKEHNFYPCMFEEQA